MGTTRPETVILQVRAQVVVRGVRRGFYKTVFDRVIDKKFQPRIFLKQKK
jgi:hypothetical protein